MKTYNFITLLEEYNKAKNTKHKIPKKIIQCTLYIKNSTYEYIYVDYTVLTKTDERKSKSHLSDFICDYIESSLTQQDIQDFIFFKQEKISNLELEIWPPTKIRYAYLGNNYFSGSGTLGKSCMRDKSMQKSLNFYIKNKIKIVVLVDKNTKIYARALLWENVKYCGQKGKHTYLDRVYYLSSHHIDPFEKLVRENSWKAYPGTSASNALTVYYKDDITVEKITHLPYADTFLCLYYKDGIITSGCEIPAIKHTDYRIKLTTLSDYGYRRELDPNSVREVFTHNCISKKDSIKIKRYDGFVLRKNIIIINKIYYSRYDKDITETILDGWILKKSSVKEFCTQNLINKEKAIFVDKYKGYIHSSNIIEIQDEIYHKADEEIIKYDTNYYHISQCFRNFNRSKVNKEIGKLLKEKDLKKPPTFFSTKTPFNDFMQQLTFMISFLPDIEVISMDDFIPKKYAIIAYDLIYSLELKRLLYQEVYVTNKVHLIKLVTGEYIINSVKNRAYLKKFNGKYYIKDKFEAPDKNQLVFPFMNTVKVE